MRKHLELKAWLLLFLFLSEIFSPLHLLGLGSGPSQPEMAAFTPAGTTEMVDPFTGDFTYNIPLMDVEGYPINIAYNSGVTMEQEASWVGLGWNLNVGTINRSVRGLPDDFNGDVIHTETSIKPMKITKFGFGRSSEVLGAELVKGLISKRKSKDLSFIYNNYKGFGFSYSNSTTVGFGKDVAKFKAARGFTLNTLDGASINASLGASVSKNMKEGDSFNFGGNLGGGYNTRTGQFQLSFGTSAGYEKKVGVDDNGKDIKEGQSTGLIGGSYIPIGMNTYTPYRSIRLKTKVFDFSGSIGGEVIGVHGSIKITGSQTVQELEEKNQSTRAFGYIYSESARNGDLKDFNRDKQVQLNQTTTHLSPTNFTYDVYSVSGQGVSGMFRPFRNDIGMLNDPAFDYESSDATSIGGELGLGTYAHGGFNYNNVSVRSSYGSWLKQNQASHFRFQSKKINSNYENVYFKAAGDKTQSDLSYFKGIGGFDAVAFRLSKNRIEGSLISDKGHSLSHLAEKKKYEREPRAKGFSYLTAKEAQYAALDKIRSTKGGFYQGSYQTDPIDRVDNNRKEHHISEITQINPDGERFVFGIPAYNFSKKEVSHTSSKKAPTVGNGKIEYDGEEASIYNNKGIDGFFSRTSTPAYAHSFLLTAKLSPDYQDVTGDGVSADDIGNSYKFDYQRTTTNYKWRAPYSGVSFMEGFKSNDLDQKGSYTYGTKELWYLHTIQSKNQIAEFYISKRDDALATLGEQGGRAEIANLTEDDYSFQLDSIVLFDKLDRLEHGSAAIPLKKITFSYDYSLCKGIENQVNTNNGKLTLKKIEITYGRSDLGKRSPYVFTYSTVNPDYNSDLIDRWGNYKPFVFNPDTMSNGDFPYTLQNQTDSLNHWASAWSLTKIQMPSGGVLEVEYEADDYGYVQQKEAMQMYPIIGAGDSTNYDPTKLSNSLLYYNDFLYFEKPAYVPESASKEYLKILFFGKKGDIDNMYYKFLTSIGSGKVEYAAGYTPAIDVGFCTNKDYLYVRIKKNDPNPISKSAWGYFRQNLFEVLYKQPNVKDTGLESILKGLAANIADIAQMLGGVESHMKKHNIANYFVPERSFVRLYNGDKFKKGGGSRVKQLTLNDSWRDMSGEGENSVYGQSYEYTTEENGRIISSGVATYEPMIGNDENPFRGPVPFIAAAKQGHIPAIKDYQETPFGESFIPSASVGYSKVTVKNIHYGKGKTSNAFTEHNFYTAKDFPVLFREVEIQKLDDPDNRVVLDFPFRNAERHSSFTASQGYTVILNDMHGKPQSTVNYTLVNIDESNYSTTSRKDLGGRIYNYHHTEVPEGKMLQNEVEVLTTDGYVKNRMLGVEYDIALDSRYSYEKSSTFSYQLNGDVIPFLGPPFLLFTHYIKTLADITELRSMVVTKTIQMYGLLASVETFTDQYSSMAYNRLYDGKTGDVLLTETKDEHNKNQFQYNIPAYTVKGQERMGAAYENIGHRMQLKKDSSSICNPNIKGYLSNGYLRHGDEVMIYPDSSLQLLPFKAWVEFGDYNRVKKEDCSDGFNRVLTKTQNLSISASGSIDIGLHGELLEEVEIFQLKDSLLNLFKGSLTEKYINYRYYKDSIKQYTQKIPKYNQWYSHAVIYESDSSEISHFEEDTFFTNNFSSKYKINAYYQKRYNIDSIGADSLLDNYLVKDTTLYDTTINPNNPNNFIINSLNLPYRWQVEFQSLSGVLPQSQNQTFYSLTDLGESLYLPNMMTNNKISLFDTIYFDLEDTIKASLEAIVAKRNASLQLNYVYHQSYLNCVKFDTSNLEAAPLLRYEPSQGIMVQDGSLINYLVNYSFQNASLPSKFWADYDPKRIYRADDTSYNFTPLSEYGISYTESQASFRIKPNQEIDESLGQKQPLLVKFKVKTPNGPIEDHYYVQYGGAFTKETIKKQFNLKNCPYDYSPYNEIDIANQQVYCPFTYKLIDENGNYLETLDEQYGLQVIRSGQRNLLTSKSGSLIAAENPVNKGINDRYLGIKGISNGIKLLQITSANYQDKNNVQLQYSSTKNPFLKGEEGSFKVDSTFRFIASRFQKNNVESSIDGYFEELPSLWTVSSCERTYLPPVYSSTEHSSSGWHLTDNVEKIDASGLITESKSHLGIYSSVMLNYKGAAEAVVVNSQQHNLAIDGFENYYAFGSYSSNLPEQNFSLINTTAKDSTTIVLYDGDPLYRLITYPNLKKIVYGIAHSGDYSLFVRGNNQNPSDWITIPYLEQVINPLEAEEIGEPILPTFIGGSPIPYETTKEQHKQSFLSNYNDQTVGEVYHLDSVGFSEHQFILNANDTNGRFRPENGEFLISLWVKEMITPGTPYANSIFPEASPTVEIIHNGNTVTLRPEGPLIDGWQKVEGTFSYNTESNLELKFKGGLWGAFYDDLRIHPSKSNLKSFVYDRYSGRLKATLDENNYATFYGYDTEGIPAQVKRETDEGIITISESRQSLNQHPH